MKLSLPEFKTVKRVFVGFLTAIGGFIFFSFFMGVILGALTDNRHPPLPEHIVLSLDLNGQFVEKNGMPTLSNPFAKPSTTLHQITRTLDRASMDERVHGLYIRLENGDYGIAHIQEFRDAINRFQSRGKFAYLYSNSFGGFGSSMGEYHIAATMDEIWMQPVGTIGLTGYSLEMPFLRGLLDKIGIEPEVIGRGKYKSAPETFALKQSSAPNLEMSRDMLNNLFDQFTHDVSLDRDMDIATLQSLINHSPMTDIEALKAGLIDSLGYWDEFIDHVESQIPEEIQAIPLGRYAQSLKSLSKKAPKFAFIQVSGAISSHSEGATPLSKDTAFAENIWDAFHDAKDDKTIDAIIFRVDSPGGSPVASETILRALLLAKKEKPVIVSMGNAAASGGYWISADASSIIAQPATITGSIGVFAIKSNLSALWKKLDVHWDTISQGDNANLWSAHKPLNTQERQKLQNLIDHTYDQFIERVATGRNMSIAQVKVLAQGRVWTGEQALDNGLVDGLGGIDTAILKGKELTNIDADQPITLVSFPKPLTTIEQIIKFANDGFVGINGFLKLGTKIDHTINRIQSNAFAPAVK